MFGWSVLGEAAKLGLGNSKGFFPFAGRGYDDQAHFRMIAVVTIHHSGADEAAIAGIDERLESLVDDAPPDSVANLFHGPVHLTDIARQRQLHPARRYEIGQG